MSRRILKGVPKVTFASGGRFTPMGSMKAVADFLGVDVTYSWLMGLSGAAFRVCWSDTWSMEMTYAAPEDVVANGGRGIGMNCKSLVNQPPEKVWKAVTTSIDSSVPVLSCGLAGAPEFCILYGYREEPRSLYVRSYFSDAEEGEVPFQPWMGWNYAGYGRFPLVLLERRRTEESGMAGESLQRALRFSKGDGALAEQAGQRGLHFGLEAYDAWIEALRKAEGDLEGKAFNMALNLSALLDARRTAGEYMQILSAMKEEWRKPLMRAYEHYRHQVSVLAEARRILYFPPDSPQEAASRAAKELGVTRLREDYSRLIRAAKQEERLSLDWIEKASE
ncbi:MAG: hypothetical protein V3U52_06975 [Thermoplasmata archaeon]